MDQMNESDLLKVMATATSLDEQQAAAAALEDLRARQRTAARAQTESMWVSEAFATAPVVPHTAAYSRSTQDSDWLDKVATVEVSAVEAERAMRHEASVWHSRLDPVVKAHPEEVLTQAVGVSDIRASQYGKHAARAQVAFLEQVKHHAATEGNPIPDPASLRPEPYEHGQHSDDTQTSASDSPSLAEGTEPEGETAPTAEVRGGENLDASTWPSADWANADEPPGEKTSARKVAWKKAPGDEFSGDDSWAMTKGDLTLEVRYNGSGSDAYAWSVSRGGDRNSGTLVKGGFADTVDEAMDAAEAAAGGVEYKEGSRRKTGSISLKNVGIDGPGVGSGTDPSGKRVKFRLSAEDEKSLKAILYSDMAINFSGVDIEESDVIEGTTASRKTASGWKHVNADDAGAVRDIYEKSVADGGVLQVSVERSSGRASWEYISGQGYLTGGSGSANSLEEAKAAAEASVKTASRKTAAPSDGQRSYCRICGVEMEGQDYLWYALSASSPKRDVGQHYHLPARNADRPGEFNAQGDLVPGTPGGGGGQYDAPAGTIYDGGGKAIRVAARKTAANEDQPCASCGRPVGYLEVFPNDAGPGILCMDCYEKTPMGRRMPTADELVQMWGGPVRRSTSRKTASEDEGTADVPMTDGSTFSSACALGVSGYWCDGYTDEGTCDCPCHNYWDGQTDIAAWHEQYVTAVPGSHTVPGHFGPNLDDLAAMPSMYSHLVPKIAVQDQDKPALAALARLKSADDTFQGISGRQIISHLLTVGEMTSETRAALRAHLAGHPTSRTAASQKSKNDLKAGDAFREDGRVFQVVSAPTLDLGGFDGPVMVMSVADPGGNGYWDSWGQDENPQVEYLGPADEVIGLPTWASRRTASIEAEEEMWGAINEQAQGEIRVNDLVKPKGGRHPGGPLRVTEVWNRPTDGRKMITVQDAQGGTDIFGYGEVRRVATRKQAASGKKAADTRDPFDGQR